MAYLLTNLLQDMYLEFGMSTTALATGGSATTAIDSVQARKHGDDTWITGGLFIVKTTDGLTPQGKFEPITDYDDATGTFTFATMTDAVEAGDKFAFSNKLFPLLNTIEIVNLALRALGEIGLVDTTTLDSASNKTEYAMSVEWKRRPPTRIQIQTLTGDANDNRWRTIHGWEYSPAVGGSAGLIIFNQQLPVTRDMKVWYEDTHARVDAYNDTISETIPPALMLAYAVERAYRWQSSRSGGSNKFMLQRWNKAADELDAAMRMYKIWKPARVGQVFTVDGGFTDPGEPGKVRL